MKKRALAVQLALAGFLVGGAPAFVPGEWIVTLRDSSPLRSALEQATPEEYPARLAELTAIEAEICAGLELRPALH